MRGKTRGGLTRSILLLGLLIGLTFSNRLTSYAETAPSNTTATVGSYTILVPANAEIPTTDGSTNVEMIQSSGSAVTMNSGWYAVSGEINITNQIQLNGNVNIILLEGSKLITKDIVGSSTYNLTIWSQSYTGGTFEPTCATGNAIDLTGNFTVNGGEINVNVIDQDYDIKANNVTVNAGTLTTYGAQTAGIYTSGTLSIPNPTTIYAGATPPGALYTDSDYSTLGQNKYIKIQCQNNGSPSPLGNGSASSVSEDTCTAMPVMEFKNYDVVKPENWETVSDVVKNVKVNDLKDVTDASDSMLQLNIVGLRDKYVPSLVIGSLKEAKFRFFHIFIGEGDAITFDTLADNSKYTGVSFRHTDTASENGKTIKFDSNESIGATVLLHTRIDKGDASVNVYRVENGEKVLLGSTVSTSDGKLCFAIDRISEYILEY